MEKTESYKRFLWLSSEEWNLILLGLIAAGIFWWVFGQRWWRLFITAGALGFVFEASMASLFTYCEKLSDRHCIKDTDVNFFLSLGWLEVFAFTCLLAEKVLPLPSLPGYVVAGLIVGNVNEFFFYLYVKRWTYNYDAKLIGNFRPFKTPYFNIAGVPLQVVVGYANVSIFVYFIVKYLVV
jgi:hypothetical protein